MRKRLPSFPWSKYISGLLIFALLFSQTIRMDFFTDVQAKPEQYRDVVSIFVDATTYTRMRTKITRYASDIQGYLGTTRVSLFVVDKDTAPVYIAAKNEKLFLEGDGGSGISKLVGTVLIGDIPVPMVGDGGAYFPTVYPYVDFVDKAFVYNTRSKRYESVPDASRKTVEADIWHGDINPAIGRDWDDTKDFDKIANFLDKTHDFYTKSGKFAPSAIPPRVFYYDGEYESQSVNFRSLFQYALSMQNAENLAYKRFTKYLLKDLSHTLKQFDAAEDQEYNDFVTSLGLTPGGDNFDDATINDMQDIHTRTPIQSILKDFQSIINKNTLSDALANVHNAGRYNNETTVRVDIAPLQMTIMDEIARSTLKSANDALMESIDKGIRDGNMAKKIPIFDSVTSSGITYDNYFFGKKSATITKPEQCTLARGSNIVTTQFGKDELVEANAAYDYSLTQAHVDKLKIDTEQLVNLHKSSAYACFNPTTGVPKIASYWGGNTLLRVVGSSTPADVMKVAPGAGLTIKGYSESVFSLGGMKETTRLTRPTLADCMDSRYQYALMAPHKYDYTVEIPGGEAGSTFYTCTGGYPKEWNLNAGVCYEDIGNRTPRYTCMTQHVVRSVPTLRQSISDYNSKSCFAGKLRIGGTVAVTANRTCITTVTTGGEDSTSYTVDETTYEDTRFHTIPSMQRHISPTNEEISAAETNGVTPSLPVDMVRYLEFLTPKGNTARINYPNFFEAPKTDRAAIRNWLKGISDQQWNAIISRESSTSYTPLTPAVEALLVSGSLPASPIDWNTMISDESIDMILRARNWLNPDVTTKYKHAVETSLSYSHEYPGLTAEKQPPKYPIQTNGYEIAYLGLAPFIPASSDNIDEEISRIQQDYNLRMSEIRGLNISEPYDGGVDNPYANSDQCGPPEGVDIFQWPAAIMCWISTLLPPRIIAGSCGSNTVGMDSNSNAPLVQPPAGFSADEVKMREFYEGGKLTYSLERTSMVLRDMLDVSFNYTKNAERLLLPSGSSLKMDILSLKDSAGATVPQNRWGEFIEISPRTVQATDAGGKFIIASRDKKFTVQLRSTVTIILPGGAKLEKQSDPIDLRINDEYLQVLMKNDSLVATIIDATVPTSVTFDTSIVDQSGAITAPQFPLKLDVFDDVSGERIASGIVIPASTTTLSETYTKNVGVYRLQVRDSLGRMGETTLAVRAGDLSKIVLSPISTMIRKGSNTLAIVRLQDRLGNQISPDLNRITIGVSGGYLSDANGDKTTTMTIDAMDADTPVLIGSDTVGVIDVTIESDKGIRTTGSIRVLETINAVVVRSANPKIGGAPVTASLKIVDGGGNTLDGFASIASLDIPGDAGKFDRETVPIKNGVTESFTFTPGTRSGIHKLRLDIPGIGSMGDIDFSVLPGDPLYITHAVTEEGIRFSLNDRYGNISNANLPGTLKFNIEDPVNINFQNGVYIAPNRSGYYTINVPGLASTTLTYTDASGEHSVGGLPFYATYVDGPREKFDFLPDYNARYSVLYGDSYLREAEDILYDSDKTKSQSIAVTTLLDSPFLENNLVTVTPGGQITLSRTQEDSILESNVSLESSYPMVHIQDIVSQRSIAHILYKLQGATLEICSGVCKSNEPGPKITLTPDEDLGFTGSRRGTSDRIYLENGGTEFLSVDRSGRIVFAPGTTLSFRDDSTGAGVVFDVESGGTPIATLNYITDPKKSVELSENIATAATVNTPIIDKRSGIAPKKFSDESLSSKLFGYTFIDMSGIEKMLDDKEIGPNGIDSLANTHDSPGVGWKGSNRSLLSYAAGDTVGEATKWFHTYTMINMGDPVAHVDHMAPGTTLEGIDRTIGTQITSNLRSGVASYAHRDMDKDGYADMITLDRDGYLNLLLNMGSRFRPREVIAYTPDLVERGISLGDFHGDGYADILGIDNSGSLVYVGNIERRFSRMNPIITGGDVPAAITDFKIYDMDADGRDDVVYLSELGELGILYGTITAGTFGKKILDSTLGITLSNIPETVGGAVFFNGLPQIPAGELGVSQSEGAELDDSVMQSEVYYQYSQLVPPPPDTVPTSDLTQIQAAFDQNLNSVESSTLGSITETYVKSQYAPAYNIEVSRTWKNISHTFLQSGDRIVAEVTLKNTGNTTLQNIKFLDSVPDIFDASNTESYEVILGNEKVTRQFNRLSIGAYDAEFEGRDIPAGQTLTIRYEMTALPARHGEMMVGNLEGGEAGMDAFGDVGFKASISCGADMLLWRSGPGSRDYVRGTRTFSEAELPDSIKNRVTDADGDQIPDSMENMTNAELKADFKDLTTTTTSSPQPLLQAKVNPSSNSIEIGFDANATANIESMMQSFFDGLSCGFGGGSCMSFPINWAPLAPGGAPSIFGFPVFPLIPETGYPLFSALSWQQAACGPVPCCLPSAYPPSVQGFGVGVCTLPSMGGMLGTWDPTNNVRFYVTPTLTMGIGAAVCFAGPASAAGRIPPPMLFGLVQGGNCIVMAKPMPFCKGDGSSGDGDVTGVSGLGSISDTWNASSCRIQAQTGDAQRVEDRQITNSIVDYLRSPTTAKRTTIYNNLSQRTQRTVTTGPAIRIGGGSSGGANVGIEIDSSKPFTMGNIVKVDNGRVPAFPEFIMNWVSRQTDEIVNALFTAPSLVVIWPGILGANLQFDGNWENLKNNFGNAYSSQTLDNIKTQMGQAYSNTDITSSLGGGKAPQGGLAKDFKNWQNKMLSGDTGKAVNSAAGGLASVRAAYKLIGQLPFITIRRSTVNIDVPWISAAELDKYAKSLENYEKEYNKMLENWCASKTPQECADAKVSIGAGGLMGSLRQNLSRIQEYKNFPAKLQKYVTWKQRYMSQLMCNVETVRQMLGGWIKDNGIRFRKWAELFVLIKAIAESWQPLMDLFNDTSKQCGVCLNQRFSTLHWKLKILSAVIPSPPIIKFPRWPDIVLDLSDIRLGINVSVPDFRFNVKPLRLPDLPRLSLPNSPTLALNLPSLPILPALPKLPDLPDLPSLPRIVLPNLPPPPKIPKLFGSIAAALKIFKLLSTVYCFLNNTFLVPEGEVGDVIAKRTERQGKLSLDFLNIQFPNFTLPSVREIRVSTHVNFELRSDFITEFAKQAVKPINEFTTDLGRGIPKKIAPDVNIQGPSGPIDLTPRTELMDTGSYQASLQEISDFFESESKILLDTDEFAAHMLREFDVSGLPASYKEGLQKELKKSAMESDKLINGLIAANDKKYDALVKYIQAEYDSTARLQNIVDMLSSDDLGDLSYDPSIDRSQLVSNETVGKEEKLLSEYEALNGFPLAVEDKVPSDAALGTALGRLSSRLSRLASTVPPGSNSDSMSDVMAGYAPTYDGVFILTPSGVQTRLFDYTELLSPEERLDTVDIDNDGDKDYIFRLDGVLYIKYTGVPHRGENVDTTLSIASLSSTDALPDATNFFHEVASTPKSLSITFTPATPVETEWRMTFFDKYLEWDMLALGLHNGVDTPERVVDFYTEEPPISTDSSGESLYTSTPILRSLKQVYDTESFLLIAPKITVLGESTNFTLSAGRKLYTGKDPMTFVTLVGTGMGNPLTLLPYRSYIFRDALRARVTSGKAYTFGIAEDTVTYTYSDDYIGMPLVNGIQLTTGNGGFVVTENSRNKETEFPPGSQYFLRSLGYPAETFNTTISYPNGMYSARIRALTESNTVRSEVVLFSPQIASDTSAPVIDFPDTVRVPVYATGTFDLTDYISEMHSYTVSIDEDITLDENGNGISEDDFTTTGSKISLRNNILTIAPHTSLDTATALLRVTDENGNTSLKGLTIEIYAPVPQITSITGTGWIDGGLDEKIIQEPIHLFRVRPGTDIIKLNPNSLLTDVEGIFMSGTFFRGSGAVISLSGIQIPLSEGGVLGTLPAGYSIDVVGASADNPLRILLRDERGVVVYSQFLVLPDTTRLMDAGDTTPSDTGALIVTPRSGYTVVQAGMSDPSIPGGLYLVDSNYQGVAAIAQDGNVYLLSSTASLMYGTRDGYISLGVLLSGSPVANIWYKTSFFYTVK